MELEIRRGAGLPRRMLDLLGCGLLAYLASPTASFGLEAGAVFKQADPSIVVVLSEETRTEDGSLGSGVIIGPREVVTNCHVVQRASKIVVVQGSVRRGARLRFQDPARDLCQIRLDDAFPTGKPVERLVSSSELEVGQEVFAVGSPRGLEHTLTRGIISALRETKTKGSWVIQTDAAISPGSSGGGLFDQEARLIGITTFGAKDSQGLNFAIPAEWIAELAARNRDRLDDTAAAAGTPSGQQPTAEPRDSRLPSVGDRWSYRLSHRAQAIGTVTVEIVEAKASRVKERITFAGFKSYFVERAVETSFSPTRYEPPLVLPGGYQLMEIAPYFPAGTEITVGQVWSALPAELNILGAGRARFTSDARVVRQETVRVPAGEFEAWRVETVSNKLNQGGGATSFRCTFWYAPKMMRTVKMNIVIDSLQLAASGDETYELSAFQRAK
jgi:serine protease Do